MHNTKLIIFDWDGTLWDSTIPVVTAFQQTAAKLKLQMPATEFIRSGIGLNLADQARRLFPTVTYEAFVDAFRPIYAQQGNTVDLFPQTRTTLEILQQQGYQLAIATSKYRKGLIELLDRYQMHGMFSTIRCGDDGDPKPNPEMLYGILTELDVSNEAAVMIGDTEHDMFMAQQAGVPRIAVTYGVADKKALLRYDPAACIDSVAELQDLFCETSN